MNVFDTLKRCWAHGRGASPSNTRATGPGPRAGPADAAAQPLATVEPLEPRLLLSATIPPYFVGDIDLNTGTGTGPDGVVRILGDDAEDFSGMSVSSAGDVNGDGYDDFVIGAYGADPAGGTVAGETYLVFGHDGAWSDIDFNAAVPSSTAVRILGDDAYDNGALSVSSAGDVNGDGYGDFLIGACVADPAGGLAAGETYLVFGHDGAWSDIDLDTGTGTGPAGVVRILGDDGSDLSGHSVSSAGDVNGDGYDDFLIGAVYANPAGGANAGETYLVFGHSGPWSDIDLNTGTGTGPDGVVRILGDDAGDESGWSVSSAGDVNGDAYDDFVIGAPGRHAGETEPGETYLVFGHSGPWSDIDFNTAVPPSTAIRILGDDAGDRSGRSVSSAGDVNGDGYDDFLIGAAYADPAGGTEAGETYLVFGHDGAWSDIDLDTGTGTGPVGVVRILGDDTYDWSGISVSSAGDVNDDGYDDFLIGADRAEYSGAETGTGETYLVFGHDGAWSDIDLNTGTRTGPDGVIRILGDDAYDKSGWSVSSAGDVNADGYDDFLIGAPYAEQADGYWAGETYLVFGRPSEAPDLPDLSGRVYEDVNNNGVDDGVAAEPGIGGVTVSLAGPESRTAVTAADGTYQFEDVLAGTYSVSAEQPAGWLDGDEAAGTLGGTVDNTQDSNTIGGIVVQAGGSDGTGYTFGEIRPSTIQGLVWEDFNNDGEVNFGERAIEAVAVGLTGTDDRGNAVDLTAETDADGVYAFLDLRPGDYTLTETQPAGFVDGVDVLGTVNGLPTGVAGNDVFSGIGLSQPDSIGENYNFGERPTAGGSVTAGQTAGGGFWQNKNGQALILSLNGDQNSTLLGNWLAATLPNMYGAAAGASNLTGMTNVQVADFYRAVFRRKRNEDGIAGPAKVDAHVLAVALATYVTNQSVVQLRYDPADPANPSQDASLIGVVESYGFLVTEYGVGAALFNIGDNGDAFGVADDTDMAILDLLLATNDMTVDGVLYDTDGSGSIDTLEQALRAMANDVYNAINEQGEI